VAIESIPINSACIVAARRIDDAVLILEIRGDISFDSATLLRTEIFVLIGRHPTRRLVLNLAQCTYLGSAGLGVIIELLRKFPGPHGVVLSHVQPPVHNIIKLMKLFTIFTIVPDDQAAVALS
jgi:anti-anti-sigma factor